MALNYTAIRKELFDAVWAAVSPHLTWTQRNLGGYGVLQGVVNSFSDATLQQGVVEAGKGITAFTVWYTSTVVPAAVAASDGELEATAAAKGVTVCYNVLRKYSAADPEWWTDEEAALAKTKGTTKTPVASTSGGGSGMLLLVGLIAVGALVLWR